MFFCKFSALLLLLLLALNCRTTLEQYFSWRTCLLRICTGNYNLIAYSTPPGSTPNVLQEEADAVNALVRLMPLSDSSFYCSGYDSLKYSQKIECDCSLEGSRLCRVTEIDLSNQGLEGQMTEYIGSLTYLRTLDLSGNGLNGPIPVSLGNLPQLQFLDLCNNELEGHIPSSIGRIKSLQYLYLCSNYLNGSIPRELGMLPSLYHLNIRFNFLEGRVPNELCSLPSLVLLDLHDNQLEGQLPQQLGDLSKLQAIYLMNNKFDGELPSSIGKLKNLQTFNIEGNSFSGTIPQSLFDLQDIQLLWLMGNNFQGPLPSKISSSITYLAVTNLAGGGTGFPFPEIQHLTRLQGLTLRNCSLTGPIPDFIWHLRNLSYLDLSFNSLTGGIPTSACLSCKKIFLRRNKLNESFPTSWLRNSTGTYVDVSENLFTNVNPSAGTTSPDVNLFECCSNISNMDMKWQDADYYCENSTLRYDHLYINCGGNETSINGSHYEADLKPNGGSSFFLSDNKAWAYSSMGTFLYADSNQYIVNKTCNISMADAPLYTAARVSPISLKYYGFCLRNDNYTVRLHFAEIGWDPITKFNIKRNRVFDVEIQGRKVQRDFNIEEAAGGLYKDITLEFNISVNNARLEIHLYWSGKGSTTFPTRYYGPLISAISVSPVPKTHNKLSSGGVVGIVGSSVLLGLTFSPFWILGWFGVRVPEPSKGKYSTIVIVGIVGSALVSGILLLALSWMLGWIGPKKLDGGVFDFKKLKAATNNFDPTNRIGGVGSVYKGVLPDEKQIAVKQLSTTSKVGAREFINAIGTISALQHPNLATLIGSCREQKQLLLVYEYMENISLQHALFGPEEVKSKLNWKTRFNICLGIAKGLAYLHDSEMEIIHSNIKPTNILLDKDFTVKISDFGFSQLHDSQLVDTQLNKKESTCGSMPKSKITLHMAPEYVQGLPLTPKADVYSFGIVTLEIVSGRELLTFRSKDQNVYLLNEAYRYWEERNLIGLVDPRLGSEYKYDEALTILHLAMQCVSPSSDLRPTMPDVVKILEGKKKFDISSISVPRTVKDPIISEPKATFSRPTRSGSTSQEEASCTTISPSAPKEANDSIISTG